MTVWRMAMRCGSQGPSMFEKCREHGVAAITYDYVEKIDFSKYSEDNLPEAWHMLTGSAGHSLRKLVFRMKKGDIIYVKHGSQIVGRGVVMGPYKYMGAKITDRHLLGYNYYWWSHTVPVKWEKDFKPVEILLGAEQHTILRLDGERLKRLEAALAEQCVPPRVLFARVGWMKYYDGPREGDPKPVGGGKNNIENIGHEIYNYHDINGYCYAFFEPPGQSPPEGKKNLSIDRITRNADWDSVPGVTVVFVARRPEGGQVVVGWHHNATVFRKCQRVKRPRLKGYGYYCKTRTEDVILLTVNERVWSIPSDHTFGNANICYMLNADGSSKKLDWQQDILDKIRNYTGPNFFRNPVVEEEEVISERCGGQGYDLNGAERRIVEDHAMKAASKYFGSKGYAVDDRHKNEPYDFVCRKGTQTWYIEVKGTTGQPKQVFLTRNEVRHARDHPNRSALFVLHGIRLNKEEGKASGGTVRLIKPWCPEKEALEALQYAYTLPEEE